MITAPLRKWSYLAGVRGRNALILKRLEFLLDSQGWSRDALLAHQLSSLKNLLKHAHQSCDYYKRRFSSVGLSPEDITSLDDLKSVPVLEKPMLLENRASIQLMHYPEKLFYSETSGSTGRPLVFYRNADWDAWHRASVFRGYSWYGVRPWERNGYLWGYNFSPMKRAKTRWLDFLQNRFRLFSYQDDEIDAFLNQLQKASYLGGYSSMIYEVAKRVNALGRAGDFRLKMVKGTSEKIFDSYQEEVFKAFGRRITSEYGAAEAGIIAFECPSGSMHVNMETAIVEEEDGQIVITNLVSRSFPIIRYMLGDYIKLDWTTQCECGMKHPIVREILGRVGKVIYGTSAIYPSLTLYYVFKNLAMTRNLVLNYQAVQRERGRLAVAIEGILSDSDRVLLEREFEKYFHEDISVVITDNQNLKSDKKKKVDFVSEIA